MTYDEPLCMSCKNFEGCKLCKKYGECPENIFTGEECKYYDKHFSRSKSTTLTNKK